jgi:c-di-GMP-binding flagellar brake protein YcgR
MYMKRPSEHIQESTLRPEDRRTNKRRHLIYYLRVWQIDNQSLLGHVVDINTGGLMLISEKPVPIGKELNLEIRLPDTDGELKPLNFRAICRWSDNDINAAFYDSGFEFLDKSPAEVETLQLMIEEYGFKD